MHEIREIGNPDEWRGFVESLNLNTFLHSPEWAEMNRRDGHKIWQLGLYQDERLLEICLVIKIAARRGTFLFTPHGPQGPHLDQPNLTVWKVYLTGLCKRENAAFWRVSPIVEKTEENAAVFASLGFLSAPIHMHKELTSVVDLTQTEDQVLAAMRKTTRQMVRKGLNLIQSGEVEVGYPDQISAEMHQVYASTAKRGHFVPFSREFLDQEWACFRAAQNGRLITIAHQGKILSWGMVLFCGRRAFYHQGANLLDKQIPAAYLTHFMGMRAARERGAISYDFWGVGPKDQPQHPWASISLFKRGFGGEDQELLHAQDLVIQPWNYRIAWLIDTYRAYKRGFKLPAKG